VPVKLSWPYLWTSLQLLQHGHTSTVVIHTWIWSQNVQALAAPLSKEIMEKLMICMFKYDPLALLFVATAVTTSSFANSSKTKLRQIPEQICVIFVSFQVVSRNQIFNPLLNCLHIRLCKCKLIIAY